MRAAVSKDQAKLVRNYCEAILESRPGLRAARPCFASKKSAANESSARHIDSTTATFPRDVLVWCTGLTRNAICPPCLGDAISSRATAQKARNSHKHPCTFDRTWRRPAMYCSLISRLLAKVVEFRQLRGPNRHSAPRCVCRAAGSAPSERDRRLRLRSCRRRSRPPGGRARPQPRRPKPR